MKLSKVTYTDLKVLMQYVSEIAIHISGDWHFTKAKKVRLVAEYDLAADLAKKIATKMINLNGKKHCSISLKSYEAVLFLNHLDLFNRKDYNIVVYEKHLMHIHKELFTRNINSNNERQH